MLHEESGREIPLFGYNKSSVPSLILCGELVPFAQMEPRMGSVGLFYIQLLRNSLGCTINELWMDPTQGRFCRGPIGPKCWDWPKRDFSVIVPSDVEFLKEDVITRYFASKQNDPALLYTLTYSCHYERLDGDIPATYVISGLTDSAIAFVENVRWESWEGCLDRRRRMRDGTRRFRLRDGRKIAVDSFSERTAWLAQALSVFHAHNISLDEAFSTTLVFPRLELTGTLQKSKHKRQRRQVSPPIYLIVLPSPYPLYHWSLDPAGQTPPLSPEMCKYFGLPFKLFLKVSPGQCSWPTKVYKLIHDYQIARNFDPKTSDFARSLGYPIFTVIPAENRFQEIVEEHPNMPTDSEPVPDSNLSYQNRAEDQSVEEEHSFLLELLFDNTEGATKETETVSRKGTKRSLGSTLLNPFIRGFRFLTCNSPDVTA
ncbi:hypothetical protein E1B28_011649 [Marasmius oreades]|uniref:Uncharacterized protein n=1 Tax=Marasmius oreades TaxID=181124 RepID=A0A9P7RVX8_9AGAR|nr:uncharacterized protein E1B28_011649 [Marasmius oreades]KAG7090028.1 hypothetical protein E1B28_011649 [Marasmius oreades]